MTTIGSLQPADPTEIGGFSLLGRLREDDLALVFLARAVDDAQVEIAWMQAGSAGFETIAASLTDVSAPSLARVIATGVLADRPYLVSEHVTGSPLQEVVARAGPWPGPALHRLGIAMASALVGLHQRGVTHGDLRPGTVLVDADGITVTGYGLSGLGTADSAEVATRALGHLAYTAPEQVTGGIAGPAGDVFAWAATLLFAATGAHAFEGESMAATVNRVAQHQPGLEALEEHLRPIVAACLAKDPAQRPEAGEVLLRLVGHSTRTVMGDQAPAAPRRTPWPVPAALATLAAGGVAVAVAAAVTGHVVAERVVTTPAAAVVPTVSLPDLSATASGPATLPSPATTTRANGIGLTLHEHPDDLQRIVAYRNERGTWLRSGKNGEFVDAGVRADDVAAAPNGSWYALLAKTELTLIARVSGERFTVRVPKRSISPVWDRGSSRLLLTLTAKGKDRPPTGFAVVDAATRAVRTVDTDERRHKGSGAFGWMPSGDQVAVTYTGGSDTGLRIRDLEGRQVRTMSWTGASIGRALTSPSGRLLMTDCPSGGSQCAWDPATGARVATYVNTIKSAENWGWYDDDHLIILDPNKKPVEFLAMDFRDGNRRLLATLTTEDNTAGLRLARAAR
ncbi:serine/threonine protein kinase [Nonomuraea glycinis]|uniref:serine/threonine protein kinase n=1 Tax=Nonomuraea glycinis TaxID=2047744 RepID=UPI002E100C1F|nr:serine/threonine protein kinase [Nonomuraea glycinis]